METHEVLNQAPPLQDYDLLGQDRPLLEALERLGAATERAGALGRLAAGREAQEWGRLANENPPRLRTHDRYGHRTDEVEFHPAWHELLRVATSEGLHASPWAEPGPHAHLERAAAFYAWSQAEAGHGCPVSMTYAAVAALRTDPTVAADWEPLLTRYGYDGALRPAADKPGALAGMGMTEKQGGSDVRANTTRAVPDGDGYRLTGHKWFTSAPMCDVFLVLAQAPGGISCFVVPRVLPDASRNPLRLVRLKDKLGNRSNASSELELDGTWGRRLGEEGRGVRTIIEMVALTRLDCVTGSAALMRQAVAQATHHAAHRSAFGARLADQPLMRNVLADLAVESEAATALMVRLADATDRGEAAFRRVALPVGKYWVCKRAISLAAEALECLGGNGYVEDSGMPRLLREAPVNSVWEGSGNVNALDVLRALGREPGTRAALDEELAAAAGADARYDAAHAALTAALDAGADERGARHLVERIALLLQGSLLLRHSPPAVADAFCASRLGGEGGLGFGTLPPGADLAALVERATPKLG